jgi:hypothetical protein
VDLQLTICIRGLELAASLVKAFVTLRGVHDNSQWSANEPKVPADPEAKIRGSQKGFQWVVLGLERVPGVLKGVP